MQSTYPAWELSFSSSLVPPASARAWGTLRAKFPEICPAHITEPARCPGPSWPSGSSGHPKLQGGVCTMDPCRQPQPLGCRGSDGRETLPARGGRSEGSTICRTQPPVCALQPTQLTCPLKVGRPGGAWGEGLHLPLTTLSSGRTTTQLTIGQGQLPPTR